MSDNKQFLFVCGVGRSGTTALCEVLNLHEKIVLGIERYKYRMIGKNFPVCPSALFKKDRFFDYRTEDTNIRIDSKEYGTIYETAKKKFDTAIFVGDKIPGLYKKLPAIKVGFPGCKVIYILRDPIAVAYSWHNRASKGRESWPSKNGYEAGVLEWNRSLRIIRRAKSTWGDDLILLNYETIFGANSHAMLSSLFRELEIDHILNPEIKKFLDKSIEAADRNREIPAHIVNHIKENANYEFYRDITAEIFYRM